MNTTLQSLVLDFGRCVRRGASDTLLQALPGRSAYLSPRKCNATHVDLFDCIDAACRTCQPLSIPLPLADPHTLKCTGSTDIVQGASACSPCPSGTFSSFPNASSIASCLSCQTGTVSSPGSSICRACPSGFYAGIDGSSAPAFNHPAQDAAFLLHLRYCFKRLHLHNQPLSMHF